MQKYEVFLKLGRLFLDMKKKVYFCSTKHESMRNLNLHINKLIVLLVFIIAGIVAQAQSYTFGIEPERDSAAFAAFRERMKSQVQGRPTVALVLSGGGAKGAAHVSVIQFLEDAGVPIDMVVGTSIGSLVGGLYACGYSGNELEQIIRNLDWETLLTDSHSSQFISLTQKEHDSRLPLSRPFGKRQSNKNESPISLIPVGIVEGQNIYNLLSSLTAGLQDERDFLTLPKPFVCVATDMVSGKAKIWHSGNLVDAMRSSMAIPGLFTPVRTEEMVLLDGCLRSNFPVEVARSMGADIVIGVDVSAPAYGVNEINTLLDIVYQTMDVLGREPYIEAIADCDIYIHPDLLDFSQLSFDAESIDTMLERGRIAAMNNAFEIAQLLHKTGKAIDNTRDTHNLNIDKLPVTIAGIDFEGIDPRDEAFLRRAIEQDSLLTKEEIEKIVDRLIGTNTFEQVTYSLHGKAEPYTLTLKCKSSASDRIGIGLRFDTKDYVSLLFSFGLNTHRLGGYRLYLDGQLGPTSSMKISYEYLSKEGLKWEASSMIKLVGNGEFLSSDHNFRLNFLQHRIDLAVAYSPLQPWEVRGGLRLDYFHHDKMLVDYTLGSISSENIPTSNSYLNGFVSLRMNTYDNVHFPKSGWKLNLYGNYYLLGWNNKISPFLAIQFDAKPAKTFGRITAMPFTAGRYVSAFVIPYLNFLSPNGVLRPLDQQIPFIGLNQSASALQMLGTAGLSLRFNINQRHFVTATTQWIHQSPSIREFFNKNIAITHFGFGVEYAYNTRLGPLCVDLHWSNLDRSLGFFLRYGFEM